MGNIQSLGAFSADCVFWWCLSGVTGINLWSPFALLALSTSDVWDWLETPVMTNYKSDLKVIFCVLSFGAFLCIDLSASAQLQFWQNKERSVEVFGRYCLSSSFGWPLWDFFQCSSMNSAGKKIILGADVQRSKKSCINASIQKHLSCFHEEKLRPLMVQKPEDSMPLCVGNEQVNGQ